MEGPWSPCALIRVGVAPICPNHVCIRSGEAPSVVIQNRPFSRVALVALLLSTHRPRTADVASLCDHSTHEVPRSQECTGEFFTAFTCHHLIGPLSWQPTNHRCLDFRP